MINPDVTTVIFDCDGTLVDSEPVTARVLSDGLKSLGFEMGVEETATLFVGRDMPGIVAYLESRMGKKLPENFVADFRQRQAVALTNEVVAIDGAFELMQSVRRPYCLASNAPQDKININLNVTGLNVFFDAKRIFSAYDIEVWKPEPDLFLLAAQTMGVAPSQCVVIEDSAAGVDAGLAAGMQVIGYCAEGNPSPSDQVPLVNSLWQLVGEL